MKKITEKEIIKRQPVVVVVGHIDHGKSTLLDYIRKTKVVEKEAGGITQHIGAYEAEHTDKEGKKHQITFIDTPGHSAFTGVRERGVKVADIAILVISSEEGVKPQTVEALKSIQRDETPFVVALSKIDRPEANIEKVKQNLMEHEVYVEGYGGTVSCVPISAKTGEGISDLLDIISLMADIEDLKGELSKKATGTVIETNNDSKNGITATVIIQNGTLEVGQTIIAGDSYSNCRSIENHVGKKVDKMVCGKPAKISTWNSIPPVGSMFETVTSKQEAIERIEKNKEIKKSPTHTDRVSLEESNIVTIPLVLKADVAGSLEAILGEIKKISTGSVILKIIQSNVGTINEGDIKIASGSKDPIILGFNVKTDIQAKTSAERMKIPIYSFDIIYKLTEWLQQLIAEKTPKIETEESTGVAKILKVFSKDKDKQIIGGRVETGSISSGSDVKVLRRGIEIAKGKIRNLEQHKQKVSEVKKDTEFGTLVECKIEIAPGDKIETFVTVLK